MAWINVMLVLLVDLRRRHIETKQACWPAVASSDPSEVCQYINLSENRENVECKPCQTIFWNSGWLPCCLCYFDINDDLTANHGCSNQIYTASEQTWVARWCWWKHALRSDLFANKFAYSFPRLAYTLLNTASWDTCSSHQPLGHKHFTRVHPHCRHVAQVFLGLFLFFASCTYSGPFQYTNSRMNSPFIFFWKH